MNDIEDSANRIGAVASLDCLSPFVPHSWWRGGWLQTLSIKALRPDLDVNRWPGCVPIEITDDGTPADTLTGFFLPPEKKPDGKPTVIIFHGMGGHARSGYNLSLATTLLSAGYPVILWNHRGAGSSRSECSRFHHPGKTDDIGRLVEHLSNKASQWIEHGLKRRWFFAGGEPNVEVLSRAWQYKSDRCCCEHLGTARHGNHVREFTARIQSRVR